MFFPVITNVIALFLCSISQYSTSLPAIPPTKQLKNGVISAKLIHYYSIESPFYNPNQTVEDRAQMDLAMTESRLNYFRTLPNVPIQSPLNQPWNHPFLVSVTAGSEHNAQYVVMDTGSSLFWIKCKENRTERDEHIYDPFKSKAISIDCENYLCKSVGFLGYCDETLGCNYIARYPSGFSQGSLWYDDFTFTSPSYVDTQVNLAFGCATNAGSFEMSGILGLGYGTASIISQSGYSEFAYCLGNISDISYLYNKLYLGGNYGGLGESTPFYIEAGHYFINITKISILRFPLDIDIKVFERHEYSGGTILDSGTSFIFLPSIAYTKIVEGVRRYLAIAHEVKGRSNDLCYLGNLNRDIKGAPFMTFYFAEGASLQLEVQNLFYQQNSTMFCLSIKDGGLRGLPSGIFGIWGQQLSLVTYSFRTGKVSFEKRDCRSIID